MHRRQHQYERDYQERTSMEKEDQRAGRRERACDVPPDKHSKNQNESRFDGDDRPPSASLMNR